MSMILRLTNSKKNLTSFNWISDINLEYLDLVEQYLRSNFFELLKIKNTVNLSFQITDI